MDDAEVIEEPGVDSYDDDLRLVPQVDEPLPEEVDEDLVVDELCDDAVSKAGLLEAAGVASLNKIYFVELSSAGMSSFGALPACRNLRMCFLDGNCFQGFEPLTACRNLRKLDLHNNGMEHLPDAKVLAQMEKLEILYLHENKLDSYSALKSLMSLRRLSILTMYSNPVALHPRYRFILAGSIPTLKCIDEVMVSDEEVGLEEELGPEIGLYGTDMKLPLSPLMVGTRTYEQHYELMRWELETVLDRYQATRPVIVLQRWFRGCICRMKNKGWILQRIQSAVVVQRFFRRCLVGFDVNRRILRAIEDKKRPEYLRDFQEQAKDQAKFPKENNNWDPSQERSLFVMADHIALFEVLALLACEETEGVGVLPTYRASQYYCIRRQQFSDEHLTMFAGVSITRTVYKHRSLVQLLGISRIRMAPMLEDVMPLTLIKRRGFTCTKLEKEALWTALGNTHKRVLPMFGKVIRPHLLTRLVMPSKESFAFLLVLVSLFNRRLLGYGCNQHNLPSIIPIKVVAYTTEVVQRLSAAVSIQSAWRAFMVWRSMRPRMCLRVIRQRTVILLQRWWRWWQLKARLHLLYHIAVLLRTSDSHILYLDEAMLRYLHPHIFPRRLLFPENMLNFAFTSKKEIFCYYSNITPPYVHQRGLSTWLDVSLPVHHRPTTADSTDADSQHASVTPDNALTELWEEFDEMMATAPQGSSTSVQAKTGQVHGIRSLVLEGTEVATVTHDNARFLGLDSFIPVWRHQSILRIKFASVEEAKARLLVMMLHTWDAANRTFVHLLTLDMLRRREACILIQSQWRGFYVRTWYRPLKHFLANRLDMSLVRETGELTFKTDQKKKPSIGDGRKSAGDSKEVAYGPPTVRELLVHLSVQTEVLGLSGLPPPATSLVTPATIQGQNQRMAARLKFEVSQLLSKAAARNPKPDIADKRVFFRTRHFLGFEPATTMSMHTMAKVCGVTRNMGEIRAVRERFAQMKVAELKNTQKQIRETQVLASEKTAEAFVEAYKEHKSLVYAHIERSKQADREEKQQRHRAAVMRQQILRSEAKDSKFVHAFANQLNMMGRHMLNGEMKRQKTVASSSKVQHVQVARRQQDERKKELQEARESRLEAIKKRNAEQKEHLEAVKTRRHLTYQREVEAAKASAKMKRAPTPGP